jgi:hypothetical protein
MVSAVLSTSFLVEPVDKITTAMLAFAIIQGLSTRFLARFPRPENVSTEEGGKVELFIAIGVIVVLVLFAAFLLRNLTGG